MLGTGFLHMCIYGQISGTALFCSFKEPPLLLGVLHPNTKLRQAERLFENQLIGPESIAHIGGKSELGVLPGCLLSEGAGSVGAAAVAHCPWTGALHILLSCGHGAWTPDITWEALVPGGSFCWSHLRRIACRFSTWWFSVHLCGALCCAQSVVKGKRPNTDTDV